MSAPTNVEKVCDLLETILEHGPCDALQVEINTGLDRRSVHRYLDALEEAGFIEGVSAERITIGDRLSRAIENRRPTP